VISQPKAATILGQTETIRKSRKTRMKIQSACCLHFFFHKTTTTNFDCGSEKQGRIGTFDGSKGKTKSTDSPLPLTDRLQRAESGGGKILSERERMGAKCGEGRKRGIRYFQGGGTSLPKLVGDLNGIFGGSGKKIYIYLKRKTAYERGRMII
jgi:hypothetical protein